MQFISINQSSRKAYQGYKRSKSLKNRISLFFSESFYLGRNLETFKNLRSLKISEISTKKSLIKFHRKLNALISDKTRNQANSGQVCFSLDYPKLANRKIT